MIDELISVVVSLFSLGAIAAENNRRDSITYNNKKHAIDNNIPYYWDGKGKIRATKTDEICIAKYSCSFTEYVGVKTNYIYYDSINDFNAKLREKGKKWRYFRIKNGLIYEKWKYDIKVGAPFKMKEHLATISDDGYLILYYYPEKKTNKYGIRECDDNMTRKIYRNDPEYECYTEAL